MGWFQQPRAQDTTCCEAIETTSGGPSKNTWCSVMCFIKLGCLINDFPQKKHGCRKLLPVLVTRVQVHPTNQHPAPRISSSSSAVSLYSGPAGGKERPGDEEASFCWSWIIKQQFALEVSWYFIASLKQAHFIWGLTLSSSLSSSLSYCYATGKYGFFFLNPLRDSFWIYNSFFFIFFMG